MASAMRSGGWLLIMLAAGVVGAYVVASLENQEPGHRDGAGLVVAEAAVARDAGLSHLLHNSSGWRLAKYTLNTRSGVSQDLQNFLTSYLCTGKTTCASDLGCAKNWRMWCEAAAPFYSSEFGNDTFELHFVDAPTLNDVTVDNGTTAGNEFWVDYFEDLNGDLTDFNAFMHNKIQLFVQDLSVWEDRLDSAGQNQRKRLATDSEGVAVALLSFAVPGTGKMYELVGPASTSADASAYTALDTATECPAASALPQPLSFYAKRLVEDADHVDDFDGSPAFMLTTLAMTHDFAGTAAGTTDAAGAAEERRRELTGAATTGGADNIATLFSHLSTFTGATVEVEADSDECTVVGVHWDNQDGVMVRYVQNKAATTGDMTLADYDKYFADNHRTFSDANWMSWDRGFDQHIGMFFDGPYDECMELSSLVRERLSADGVSVGERGEPDAHEMYSGYAGPMTWQYQWGKCDAGRASAPEECACVSTNNLDDYAASVGDASATCDELDTDWCEKA